MDRDGNVEANERVYDFDEGSNMFGIDDRTGQVGGGSLAPSNDYRYNTHGQGNLYSGFNKGVQTIPAYKPCEHKGDVLTYEAHGVRLHGANQRAIETHDADLILDCAGVVGTKPSDFVSSTLGGWAELNKLIRHPNVVRLHWTDGGAPPMGLDFWVQVWNKLPKGKVIACCIGGHGRTGTCLASLMIADGVPYREAIDQVRTIHCKEAIETQTQINYLRDLAYERAQMTEDWSEFRVTE